MAYMPVLPGWKLLLHFPHTRRPWHKASTGPVITAYNTSMYKMAHMPDKLGQLLAV